MTWERWAVFMVMEIVLSLTPGPAVLFVVAQGLRYGGMRSLWASAGILAGNAFYFALSATGLGALLLASHDVFAAVRWVGAAYLVWLGIRTFAGRGGGLAAVPSHDASDAASGPRLLGRGFVLQAANPKALVFFTALLPQFIDRAAPVWPQVLILGASSVVAEAMILAGYGAFAGRASVLARRPAYARTTNRVAGALLAGAGVGLALADAR